MNYPSNGSKMWRDHKCGQYKRDLQLRGLK
jgi:hypothetical protein